MAEDFIVTPWEVKGNVDYNRLMKEFGISSFEKLPSGTVESLLKPEAKDQLTKILTYHVVAGKFKAADVLAAIKKNDGKFSIETVSGDMLTASISDGQVVLTDTNGGESIITKTDVMASNGVIHVIDSVVLPK